LQRTNARTSGVDVPAEEIDMGVLDGTDEHAMWGCYRRVFELG